MLEKCVQLFSRDLKLTFLFTLPIILWYWKFLSRNTILLIFITHTIVRTRKYETSHKKSEQRSAEAVQQEIFY